MKTEALKICQREGLVSYMNKTKWTELAKKINAVPSNKRVKYIDSEILSSWQRGVSSPVPGYFEFSGGPTEMVYIEWMEIKKKNERLGKFASPKATDCAKDLMTILKSMNIEFEELEESFRIYGHRRTQKA